MPTASNIATPLVADDEIAIGYLCGASTRWISVDLHGSRWAQQVLLDEATKHLEKCVLCNIDIALQSYHDSMLEMYKQVYELVKDIFQ